MARLVLAGYLVFLTACGDDEGPGDAADGAVDGDGGSTRSMVAEPALPNQTPCPPGWRVEETDGVQVCEPFAGEAPAECDPHEVDLPGAGGCAPLDECPAGDFSELLPTDATVILVRPGAVGGDGTEAAPYGSISEALLRVGSGDVIALAKGSYDTLIRLPAGVTIHGACAAETILTTTISVTPVGLVDVAGPGSALRHLSIQGISRVAVSVNTEGGLELEAVSIRDVAQMGVYVFGGNVTATGLAIDGVAPDGDGTVGRGIDVSVGGSFTGSGVSVRNVHDVGVRAENGDLTLTDFVVHDVAADARTRTTGAGAQIFGDSSGSLTRGFVGETRIEGIFVREEGATFTGENLVIRDVHGRESDGNLGAGFLAVVGATAELSGILIERTTSVGLATETAPAAITLTDAVIRDVQPAPDGNLGWGMDVNFGATATMSRVQFLQARGIALAVREGSRLEANDLSIHDTRANPLTDAGVGLEVLRGAFMRGERVRIRGGNDLGIFARGDGTQLELVDLHVSDIDSRSIDGRFGRGIDIEEGALLTIERADIRRVRSLGVFVGNIDAAATLTDITIEDVAYERCEEAMTCPAEPVAVGFGAYSGARLSVSGFAVSNIALCGVQVGPAADVDLDDGEVTSCEIGACVYIPDYDIERLTRDVRYGSNGTNLVVSGGLPLPVPAPTED